MALPNVYADVAQTSLVSSGGTKPPEIYIPLWWYSGSKVSTTSAGLLTNGSTTAGSTSSPTSANTLHTLSSNWPSGTQFALEISGYTSASSVQLSVYLRDMTSGNTNVNSSNILTTTTSMTVLRSSKFTLTPGHAYGLDFFIQSGTGTVYITDASLIVFP